MRETIENKRRKRVPSEAELKELEGMRESIHARLKNITKYCLLICKKYISRSLVLNSIEDIIESYLLMGIINNGLGDNYKAIECYLLSLTYNENDKFALLSHKAYISIAVSYRQIGEYAKALEYCTLALNDQIDDFLDTIYNNVGVIYYNLNELDMAIISFEKAFAIFKAKREIANSIGILNNIIRINIIQKNFEMAESNIQKVLVISRKNKDYPEIINARFNLAILKFELGQINESYNILLRILPLSKKHPTALDFSIALLLAEVNSIMKNYVSSKKYFILAISYAKKLSSYDFLRSIEKYSVYLEGQKEYSKAIYFRKLYVKAKKNSADVEKRDYQIKSRILFENKEKQLKIDTLIKVRELNKQLEQKANQLMIRSNKLEKLLSNDINRLTVKSQLNISFLNISIKLIEELLHNNKRQNAEKFLLLFCKLTRDVFIFSQLGKIRLLEDVNVLSNYLEIESKLNRYISNYELCIDPSINLKNLHIKPLLLHNIVASQLKKIYKINNRIKSIKIELNLDKKPELEIITLSMQNMSKTFGEDKRYRFKSDFRITDNQLTSKFSEV